MSGDELHNLRLGRLKDLLLHARKHVPFYQKRFAEAGFDPEKLKGFEDLDRMPLLTKQDIQNNREQLISNFYHRSQLIENRTGGSTGSPLRFYHHRDRLDSRQQDRRRLCDTTYGPATESAARQQFCGGINLIFL
jgi:phenylacetate-CoA ligase